MIYFLLPFGITAKGIRCESVEKLFEPFFTTSHKGTGLGLYIINQLCEFNGAEINARNHPEGGAEFTISKSI